MEDSFWIKRRVVEGVSYSSLQKQRLAFEDLERHLKPDEWTSLLRLNDDLKWQMAQQQTLEREQAPRQASRAWKEAHQHAIDGAKAAVQRSRQESDLLSTRVKARKWKELQAYRAEAMRRDLEARASQLRAEQLEKESLNSLRRSCETHAEYQYLYGILRLGQHPERLAAVKEPNRAIILERWGIGTDEQITPFNAIASRHLISIEAVRQLHASGITQLLYYRTDEPRYWPDFLTEVDDTSAETKVLCLVCSQDVPQAEQLLHLHTEAQVDIYKQSAEAQRNDNSVSSARREQYSADRMTTPPPNMQAVQQVQERRMVSDHLGDDDLGDATRGHGHVYRDHGQFGSPPVHDGYGDEDTP